MAALDLARLILDRTLRSGPWWGIVASLWVGWWTLEHLLPLGLTTGRIHRLSSHYEVAFIGGVAAAALTALRLARFAELTRRLDPRMRVLTEWLATWSVAILTGLVLVLPAHALRTWQLEEFSAAASFPALVAGAAHLAALLVLALRSRSGDPLPALACALGAALLLPGLLSGSDPLSATLLATLDVGGPLRASFDFPGEGAHWIRSTLPTLGWGFCAAALATPRP